MTTTQESLMTINQIVAERPGWTRTMVKLALTSPASHLDPRYNHAPLYAISRIDSIESNSEARVKTYGRFSCRCQPIADAVKLAPIFRVPDRCP